MTINFSSKAKKQLALVKKNDNKLFKKIQKQLKLFIKDPHHPSLRLHKLRGNLANSWIISVDMSYRLVFYYSGVDDNKIVIYMFGTHKEVYK